MSCFLALFTVAIAAQLATQTKAQVVYGDEGFGRVVESGPHVQVLDDPSGDDFELAPTTQGGSSPSRYRKWTGVLVRFKGASTKPGAKLADHRGVVEALCDLFVISAKELAHSKKLEIRNVAGAVVEDIANEVGTNPASAEYQLRFQCARALNKAKAVSALQGLLLSSEVIAHRQVIPPTLGASITTIVNGVVTVGGLAGIDASFVGKMLTLSGSLAENDGDFEITAVVDAATVQITNANASIESDLTWSVSDDEDAQT